MSPAASLPHDPLWPRAGSWSPPVSGGQYDVVLVGVPTSETSLSPTTAHTTPAAVRDVLRRYSASFVQDADGRLLDLTDLHIADAGDLVHPDTDRDQAVLTLQQLSAQAAVLIALGGDNSATVPVALAGLSSSWEKSGLITLDAHFDLRDGRSNGSPIRELLEAGLDGHRITQLGIADFANSFAYAQRAKEAGITVVPRSAFRDTPIATLATRALEVAGSQGGPIHVDIDVDVCDRAVAPATPASLPGGLGADELRHMVRLLASDPRVVSFDITEIDAGADTPDQRTTRLAALLVLEVMAGVRLRTHSLSAP